MKKFKKGDTVIYPQHGACTVKVIKRIRAFDVVQDYLILESVMTDATGKGMTLSVPVAKVYDLGIRPPVSKSELQDLVDVLSKPDPRVPANWSRRFKNHQEKLKSGDVYQVAEVVRNLAARDRENQLSAAEKTMYERARLNLISRLHRRSVARPKKPRASSMMRSKRACSALVASRNCRNLVVRRPVASARPTRRKTQRSPLKPRRRAKRSRH